MDRTGLLRFVTAWAQRPDLQGALRFHEKNIACFAPVSGENSVFLGKEVFSGHCGPHKELGPWHFPRVP